MGKASRRKPAGLPPLPKARAPARFETRETVRVVDRIKHRIDRLLDENRFFESERDEDCFRETLHEIRSNGEVMPVEGRGFSDTGVEIAWSGTAGALLLGHAEIFLQWPLEYKQKGLLIIDDLMKRTYAGAPIDLFDGKRCCAVASRIAYQAVAVSVDDMSFDRHGEQYLFCKSASRFRLLHLPVCFELIFIADLRENEKISGTVGNVWNSVKPIRRKRNGKLEFTNLGQITVASESWMKLGLDFSVARLTGVMMDGDDFLEDGEEKSYEIIKPAEFLLNMKKYDNDGLDVTDDELIRIDRSISRLNYMDEPAHEELDFASVVSTYAH